MAPALNESANVCAVRATHRWLGLALPSRPFHHAQSDRVPESSSPTARPPSFSPQPPSFFSLPSAAPRILSCLRCILREPATRPPRPACFAPTRPAETAAASSTSLHPRAPAHPPAALHHNHHGHRHDVVECRGRPLPRRQEDWRGLVWRYL